MKGDVLIQIDDVRICEYDKLNVVIERYESVYSPIDRKVITKWRFKSYSNTILGALDFIARKELLIDKDKINDIKSYIKQVHESNEKILKAIQTLK